MSNLSDFIIELFCGPEESDRSTSEESDRSSHVHTVGFDNVDIICSILNIDRVERMDNEEFREQIEESIEQYDQIRIGVNPSGEFTQLDHENGISIMTIDPEQAPEDRQKAAQELLPEVHEERDGFSTPSASPFVYSYRQEGAEEYIDEIKAFYQGKLPSPYPDMIEDCLMLKLATETRGLSRMEVRERRSQIKSEYHTHDAIPLSSLCSAGYLGEGNFLYELYDEIVNKEGQPLSTYREKFLKYVRERPFVVFVEYNDTVTEVYDKFLRKNVRLGNYQRDIGFVDIRGTGEDNHEKIEDTINMIEEHHDQIKYKKRTIGRDLTVRFDSDTV